MFKCLTHVCEMGRWCQKHQRILTAFAGFGAACIGCVNDQMREIRRRNREVIELLWAIPDAELRRLDVETRYSESILFYNIARRVECSGLGLGELLAAMAHTQSVGLIVRPRY